MNGTLLNQGRWRRPLRIGAAGTFLILAGLCLLLGTPAAAQESEQQARLRSAGERVHRNRIATLAARKAFELASGADGEVLRVAQLVLDLDTDAFGDDTTSVRLAVESRLRSSGDEVRRKYEKQVAFGADQALAEAVADPTSAKYRQVCRRYFLTSAGYAAAEWLVAYWLDAGEFGMARRQAAQVAAEPWHRERVTPRFRKLVASLNAIGVDGIPGPASGQVVEFQRQFAGHRDALVPLRSGWMLAGGNLARSRSVDGSPPVPVAAWSTEYFPNRSLRLVQDVLSDWEGVRREADQPRCLATVPILVNGQLIFRDSQGLRSVDTASGATKWTYRCRYNPLESTGNRNGSPVRRRMSSGFFTGQNSLGENSLMGAIASDGQRVYAIDSAAVDDEAAASGPEGRRNRLVAVSANAGDAGPRLAWVHEGELPKELVKPGASNWFRFLGPPLPGPSELLCLTEHDQEVHLTALEPRFGSVDWSQPLCTIERFEEFDPERLETACLPASSDGIVVCPTGTGLLVAVDQCRGSLLWAAFVDDLPDPRRPQMRGGFRPPTIGYAGYLPHLVISDGRVLCLPSHSHQLHCLDLATGRFLWSVPRRDAEYVAAASDGRLMVVGRLGCRCLGLDDGREIWQSASGSPAGHGIAIGDRYALPLDDGHLASLDLATGVDHGTKSLRSSVPLGHLVADRDRVYSLGPRGVVAFPQVEHVLATVASGSPEERARPDRQIMLAEVAMARGNLRDAEQQLRRVLNDSLSAADRDRAQRDLKELHWERISSSADVSSEDYRLLDGLLTLPPEQFRFLVAASTRTGSLPDDQIVERLVDRAYGFSPQLLAPVDGEWSVSPVAWCRLMAAGGNSDSFRRRLDELRSQKRPRRAESDPIDDLQRYVRVFADEPGIAGIRSQMAMRLRAAGALHAAETLWLSNRSDAPPESAAEATVGLMELWENSGLMTDAVRQLELLATEYARTPLPGGQTGADFVRSLGTDRLVKQAWLQSREPAWPVDHVEICQSTAQPEFVEQLLSAGDGRESPRFQWERTDPNSLGRRSPPYGLSVEFVVSSSSAEDRQTLSVFDQRTKLRLGSLTIPLSHRLATGEKLASGGHLVPFGVPGGLIGVSTLQLGDGQPVWTQYPEDMSGRRTPVFPGPSGAHFASFVWRNRLYVVDPLDGTLLWQRLLPMDSQEMSHNIRMDVIGDHQVLGVLREDRSVEPPRRMYEVYDTATGRKRPPVRPGFVPGVWQGAFGRRVAGFVETPEGRRLQIRDLLDETPELTEAIADPNRQPLILPGGQLLFLGVKGEIKVYDVSRGRRVMSAQLAESELVPVGNYRGFFDHGRYFVNLQRHTPTATTAHTNQALTNSPVPGVHLRDDLYAFDRSTGELLWKRSIPYRTILQFPECRLPFLVTVSQVIDRVKNSVQSLTIEVIDSATGVTIGYRENLRIDQLLTAHYDGQAGRILIRGLTSDIELRFGPAEGQTQARQ